MNRNVLVRTLVLILVLVAVVSGGCIVAYETPPSPLPPPPAPPAPPLPPPPPPPPSVDIRFFWDSLDPYGDWIWIDPYGWTWAPNGVDPFWRPYKVGRWVWTDWGWMWVSREPWGWAPYHYGRWVRAKHHGWVWVPGTVWGPAWVAWRRGGGMVGWAPLPPEARFRAGIGIDWGGTSIDVIIRNDWWCFVDEVRFIDSDVARWAYPVGRNATVIRVTSGVRGVRVVDRRIVNDGIAREDVERVVRRAVPVHRVVNAGKPGVQAAEVVGNEVRVFRPEVRETDPGSSPPRGRRPSEAPGQAKDVRDPVEQEAERRWDRGWNNDWRKLQQVQKEDEKKSADLRGKSRTELSDRHREENYEAAENAYREQLAERERARRRAERAPGGAVKKPAPNGKRSAEKPETGKK